MESNFELYKFNMTKGRICSQKKKKIHPRLIKTKNVKDGPYTPKMIHPDFEALRRQKITHLSLVTTKEG